MSGDDPEQVSYDSLDVEAEKKAYRAYEGSSDDWEDAPLTDKSIEAESLGTLDRHSSPERDGLPKGAVSQYRLQWMVGILLILLCVGLGVEPYMRGTASATSMPSNQNKRQDAYAMPGYLLQSTPGTARWIPYTEDILHSGRKEPAILPLQRNATEVTAETLALAPPSFAEKLKNRDRQNPASDPELEFLQNKNILILGCSHDRNFLERFCEEVGVPFVSVTEDKHGMFHCTLPELGFQVQVWFTKGALPEPDSIDPAINFEDRVRDYWIPKAKEEGLSIKPDMIIWVSGTWDVLGLRMKYARDNAEWKEQPISWQELVWHRQRLREMISFIRSQWPDVPTIYRPPPYLYKMQPDPDYEYLKGVQLEDIDVINESIRKFEQSTEAVMRDTNMPIFRWAEKLTGNNQYSDTVHLSKEGYAQWLFADMMLYYLHYYTT